jgi:polyphosphate glucokinase
MQVLGVDIGGSGIKGALVDTQTGELVSKRIRLKTPQPATPEAVIKTTARLVEKFGCQGPIGVGFPAIVLDGRVLSAANIDSRWIGYPGQRVMTDVIGCPVSLGNDADVAGLAEVRFGAGQNRQGLIMILTLGTGIGSALFVDGRLVPNTELGHIYLPGHDDDAEEYASDRARVDQELKWSVWAGRLNEYLQHLEGLFTPNLFILGGGTSKRFKKFNKYLTTRAPVVPAVLRNEAGIVGAALLAAEKYTIP